jgi:hypothetical protein
VGYVRKLNRHSSEKSPNDARWASDNPEYKFQAPDQTIPDEDYLTPKELADRMQQVFAKGQIHGRPAGQSMRDLIRRFDPPRDGKGEPVRLELVSTYEEYVARYRAKLVCRI